MSDEGGDEDRKPKQLRAPPRMLQKTTQNSGDLRAVALNAHNKIQDVWGKKKSAGANNILAKLTPAQVQAYALDYALRKVWSFQRESDDTRQCIITIETAVRLRQLILSVLDEHVPTLTSEESFSIPDPKIVDQREEEKRQRAIEDAKGRQQRQRETEEARLARQKAFEAQEQQEREEVTKEKEKPEKKEKSDKKLKKSSSRDSDKRVKKKKDKSDTETETKKSSEKKDGEKKEKSSKKSSSKSSSIGGDKKDSVEKKKKPRSRIKLKPDESTEHKETDEKDLKRRDSEKMKKKLKKSSTSEKDKEKKSKPGSHTNASTEDRDFTLPIASATTTASDESASSATSAASVTDEPASSRRNRRRVVGGGPPRLLAQQEEPIPTITVVYNLVDLDKLDEILDAKIEAEFNASQFESLKRDLTQLDFYHLSLKGPRPSNEDEYTVIEHLNEWMGLDTQDKYSYVGVYDGHSGKFASLFTRSQLHANICSHPEFNSNIDRAVIDAFIKTDQSVNEIQQRDSFSCGSTALSVLIKNNKELIIGNVGDCRGFICRGGKPVEVAQPHNLDREDEKERIKALGGAVVWFGTWRVNGILAVSRSIGDYVLRSLVIAEPDVTKITLQDDDEFLVLASDGLWDGINGEQMIEIVRATVESSGREHVCKALCDTGIEKDTKDNVTVVALFFDRDENS